MRSIRLARHHFHAAGTHDRLRISADQVLHIGSRILNDVAPARRVGMKTGLFAGDKSGLQATPELLKDPATRPDVLLTHLEQIKEIVPE